MNVFDASALLAFVQDESGAAVVERVLIEGGVCGAANWSEVAQKAEARSANWDGVRRIILSYGLTVASVTVEDAEGAAALWHGNSALSLADRLCLSLGRRLGATVWTANREWASEPNVRVIR